ncbi:M16 family metallopeptidase [Sphingobium boeckii]|uniref:Zinc protease n=1 Tax=Sphingobium boeckii TaxID=1082345 RepID=A0A7W9AIA8_9SPHN|nr:M16 family metallopeptidase [Sphingobium boeckii]MBB5686215.1 zinc protease [Sphingobium boeckii]
MKFLYWRFAPLALISLIAAPALATVVLSTTPVAKEAPASAAPAKQQSAETPWLYLNSDVPQQKEWLFGTLPNGVRYAIRKNGVPPGQVSVRVRIDAGSLMEDDGEQGFAHFLEHLSFRGSKEVPEGESKRAWQRLGVTFGSDSNASTTATETVYKLDLPNAKEAGLDESLNILASMMESPNIIDSTVSAERAVVMAEQREAFGAAVKIGDASRETFFSGQKLAKRSTIGTVETLTGATAAGLQAFHDRWYRPERAVVVISGDMDPALMEGMVKKHFASWKGTGPNPADPDFGQPDPNAPVSAAIVEPSFPGIVQIGILRPWAPVADTIVYNEGLMIEAIALRIINRRLETRARVGGSYLQAAVEQEDSSRSADTTTVSIFPIGDDWQAAVRDVRAVIDDATTNAPAQADIDREVNEFDLALLNTLENEAAEPGSKQADDLVRAVDICETVTTSQGALDIFRGAKRLFTPEQMLTATKRLMQGSVPPRILLTTPKPVENAAALAATALTENVSSLAANTKARDVTFADLPRLGTPAKVVKRSMLDSIAIETVELSNGVKLILFPNAGEPGKIYVSARFGNGYQALPRDKPSLAWTGGMAMVPSGIGKLGIEELDALSNGRKINLGFDITEDAFVLGGETRAVDLADQLKLMAAKLKKPGWDPAPVIRARAQMLAGYEIMNGAPGSVLQRDLDALVRGGDPRWATPSRDEIAALTPKAFRKFWKPILKTGPIEVQIFGDFKAEDAIEAARQSFGALRLRKPAKIIGENALTGIPVHNDAPVMRTHKGPPDQAAAVLAWPTGGGVENIAEARRLEVLAAIFNDRLFDKLRSEAGASYSPSVSSQWPTGMANGGYLMVLGQLKPGGTDQFFKLSREIAADLATTLVEPDELARALGPIKQYYMRASTGNQFWLRETAGSTRNPQKIDAMESLASDLLRITPQDVQAMAQRYLGADKSWSMVVLPETKAADVGAVLTPAR